MNLEALHNISYGLYVLCSEKGGKFNGQIMNSIFQASAEPPAVAFAVNKKNLTWEYLQSSKKAAISVLSQKTPFEFIGRFGFKSGRETDKLKGVKTQTGLTGIPIVKDYSLSYIEVEIFNQVDVDTHTIFIGKVINADVFEKGIPLTYAYYHDVIKGITPVNAPTFIKSEHQNIEESKMNKYKCTICGYIYDPAKGDAESGIKPDTSFESLPANWVCPVCGATKDQFEKI